MGGAGSNMGKVDRDRLYTDVTYRFTYVASFLGFKEEDVAALKASAPLVAPLVPAIVKAVYDKLFSFDITKKPFLVRNEGFEGAVSEGGPESLTLEDEQTKYRMGMLSGYLVKLVTEEYDEKFISYLDHVAAIHTPKAGNSDINVEFIHINALIGYVEDVVIGAVMDMEIDNLTKAKTIRAFNKLLWLQNDLFLRHYVRDGDDATA